MEIHFPLVGNARLSEFSDEMLLINENQCRFRSGYSTTDCMFVLHSFFEILKIEMVINFPLLELLFHMETIQISFHHKINKI
jgi:hypothetical protein